MRAHKVRAAHYRQLEEDTLTLLMSPNQCTICAATLLGPPPSSVLIVAEADVEMNVKVYHTSCIERLARLIQQHSPITSDDDMRSMSTPQTGYLRTPYTSETFDDQRDRVIADLRKQLAASVSASASTPTSTPTHTQGAES